MFVRHIHRRIFNMTGERKSILNVAQGRANFVLSIFAMFYLIAALKILMLGYVSPFFNNNDIHSIDEKYLAQKNDVRSQTRGRIFDRNGTLLASNIKTITLYADPEFIENKLEAVHALQNIMPNVSDRVTAKISEGKGRFIKIADNISPKKQKEILDMGYPGFIFKKEEKRFYPQGSDFSHIIGFVGAQSNGLEGIEYFYNEALNKGDDLHLTLDTRLQYIMAKALSEKVAEFNAKSGSGIIMDVKTGDILSLVSVPDYDPNRFQAFSNQAKFNPILKGVYEMGSTFKVFSTAAWLETTNRDLSYRYDTTEPLKRAKFTINDYHGLDKFQTIPEIFSHSSNIGTALMAEDIGNETIQNFYRDLGLMDRAEINIFKTSKPLLPKKWRDINTVTASYGHGMAVTPMHVVQAMATIANKGLRVKANIIKDTEHDVSSIRVMNEDTAQQILKMLRLTVMSGTASKADVKGYSVGGKTGTAEKINAAGGYDKKTLLSSFISVFPSENPEYIIFTMIDEPKGHEKSFGYATAGWTAVPAAAQVIQNMAHVLGIDPQYDDKDDQRFLKDVVELIETNGEMQVAAQ